MVGRKAVDRLAAVKGMRGLYKWMSEFVASRSFEVY